MRAIAPLWTKRAETHLTPGECAKGHAFGMTRAGIWGITVKLVRILATHGKPLRVLAIAVEAGVLIFALAGCPVTTQSCMQTKGGGSFCYQAPANCADGECGNPGDIKP